jgi:cytochrome b561
MFRTARRIFIERKAARYSGTQRLLHWLVVVLCLSQIPTSWAIDRSHVAHVFNLKQDPVDLFFHQVHIWVGISIAFFALARLVLRFSHGVPALPEATSKAMRMASGAMHVALYALLGLAPLAGFMAAYVSGLFAPFHKALNWTLLALALIHVAAALWHHFVLGDGVLKSMTGSKGSKDQSG